MKFKLVENWHYRDDVVIKGVVIKMDKPINSTKFVSFDQPHLRAYEFDNGLYTIFKRFRINDRSNTTYHQNLVNDFEKIHGTIVDYESYVALIDSTGEIVADVDGLANSSMFKSYAGMFEDLLKEFYIYPED